MKQIPIPVITNNTIILEKLKNISNTSIFFFELYDPINPIDQYDKILIVEPYIINNQLVNIHTIWKKYLLNNGLKKQLIVAGFENSNNPNYVNILSLEKDLEEAIREAQHISKKSKYPINHEDIIEKFHVFLNGHGDKSLLQEFTKVLIGIKNMNYALDRTISTPYKVVVKELYRPLKKNWKKFITKWRDYKNYFNYSPFFEELETIQNSIDLLNPFFHNEPTKKLFKEIDCLKQVEAINQQLTNIRIYVFES